METFLPSNMTSKATAVYDPKPIAETAPSAFRAFRWQQNAGHLDWRKMVEYERRNQSREVGA